LYGEAIPLEPVELTLCDGHFDRLLLHEVRQLEFILLLQGALLVIVEVGAALPLKKSTSPS
jgi:hypothetical protein